MENKTPKEKFRNSVGFQFNFVQFSGLSVEDAIDNICRRAEGFAEAQNAEILAEIEILRKEVGLSKISKILSYLGSRAAYSETGDSWYFDGLREVGEAIGRFRIKDEK